MATSKAITLDESYKKITTQSDFLIQNISPNYASVEIFFKDTVSPLGTDKGITLKTLEVINSSIIGGTVWARCTSGNGLVSVTE